MSHCLQMQEIKELKKDVGALDVKVSMLLQKLANLLLKVKALKVWKLKLIYFSM